MRIQIWMMVVVKYIHCINIIKRFILKLAPGLGMCRNRMWTPLQYRTLPGWVCGSMASPSAKIAGDSCINCGRGLQGNKTSLAAQLPRTDTILSDYLSQTLEVSFTPSRQRYLCRPCTALVSKLNAAEQRSAEAQRAFHGATHCGSYVKRKLDIRTPEATPLTTPKKTHVDINSTPRRVVSTPVKRFHGSPVSLYHDIFNKVLILMYALQ